MSKIAGTAGPATRPDRRRSPRHQLCLDASVGVEGASTPATVLEISQSGFLLQSRQPRKTGEMFQIDLPESSHRAWAAWNCGQHSGCEFDRPLSKAELSAALLKARPAKKGERLPKGLDFAPIEEPQFKGEARMTPAWLWLVFLAAPTLWLLAMALFF